MTIKKNSHGFAITELLLILVIIGLIGGVGYWVANQRQTKPLVKQSAEVTTSVDAEPRAIGTLADIDTLNQSDLSDELKAEDDITAQEQKDAQSDSTAIKNVGDGYDVTY